MTPTDDEYAAKIAEHEAKLDKLELAERAKPPAALWVNC
jgi:hypothetical protein